MESAAGIACRRESAAGIACAPKRYARGNLHHHGDGHLGQRQPCRQPATDGELKTAAGASEGMYLWC